VPAAVMRSAAKGALSLPSTEMLQILVYLTGNPVFAAEAAMTLARFDESAVRDVLAASDTPREVVDYFLDRKNRRPALMPALIANPQVSEQQLAELAADAPRDVVELLLVSARIRSAQSVMKVLLQNPHVNGAEAQQLRQELGEEIPQPADPESETAYQSWSQEHAAEIAAEEGTAFEVAGVADEPDEFSIAAPPAEKPGVDTPAARQAGSDLSGSLKVSTLVRLSRMDVGQRVRQAFLGSKEERAILIRDSAKMVQNSVLASPKLSEQEIETFAAAKNVTENVLREIARNRRFIKIYAVVRNLVNNPRCPLDLSLTLVKNLLVPDLKYLQGNKGVPETLRKVATKLYKEKRTPVGQKAE
jgi:hypothetical protein